MKDLKEFILEKRVRELKVDGKKVPDKYIAVFNDYLVEIAEQLKTHDRELVKEVCEKIKYKLGSIEDILINLGNGKEDALNYFMHILNEIEKEFEK